MWPNVNPVCAALWSGARGDRDPGRGLKTEMLSQKYLDSAPIFRAPDLPIGFAYNSSQQTREKELKTLQSSFGPVAHAISSASASINEVSVTLRECAVIQLHLKRLRLYARN